MRLVVPGGRSHVPHVTVARLARGMVHIMSLMISAGRASIRGRVSEKCWLKADFSSTSNPAYSMSLYSAKARPDSLSDRSTSSAGPLLPCPIGSTGSRNSRRVLDGEPRWSRTDLAFVDRTLGVKQSRNILVCNALCEWQRLGGNPAYSIWNYCRYSVRSPRHGASFFSLLHYATTKRPPGRRTARAHSQMSDESAYARILEESTRDLVCHASGG